MTGPTQCRAYRGPDAKHEYHPISGWCVHGCGRRDDGYLINTTSAATIAPPPEYTPEQLAKLPTIAKEEHHVEQPTLDLSV